MTMKQVDISYNGYCCVPGPVNKLAIFGSRKNRTNCVTDHTKGLSTKHILMAFLKSIYFAVVLSAEVSLKIS